ncbi:TPA: hypothetical protein HA244_02715 [Candidatus Micrarchaeota archaeon]|nr:hypothetical protein [Candidatus Micrarchaeota archaeon]
MVAEATQIPIVEIGVIVLVALFFGMLSKRIGLSTSIGYILAGVLLGPLFSHFLTPNQGIAQLFGEIGLLLLLFFLGLELSLKSFKQTGAFAVVHSLVEMGLPFVFGFGVALFFGFNFLEALVIGAMLTATSTVMVAKFIFEKRIEKEPESRLALSILVVEDFFSIFVLAFLYSLQNAVSFKQTLLNGVLFIIAMFFVVSRVTRFASAFFEKHGRTSVMTLFALGVGIIVAYFSDYLGLTIALGAYFAGFALNETPFGQRVKREIGFMREFFILFFFVGFGTAIVFPQVSSLAFVAALLVAFVVARFIGYMFFGTALGLSVDSASKLWTLMIPIGEFSLIIAVAAAPFVNNPAELLSVAFMLMLSSTVLSKLLFENWKAISIWVSKTYPRHYRDGFSRMVKKLDVLEKVYENPALQNEFSASVKSFASNLIIALAIVYMSMLASFDIDLSFIPFVSKQVSVSVLILPLLVWPIYRAVNDLKFVTYSAIASWSKATFPTLRKHHEAGLLASELLTSFTLALVGLFSSLFFYYFLRDLIVVPLLFTLLAVMYLSKSFYSMFEQAEEAQDMAGEGISGKDMLALSRELGLRAKRLSELSEERERAMSEIKASLRAGKTAKARSEFQQFKRRERKILGDLEGYEKRVERKEFSKLSREEQATKNALEQYFLKQGPRIIAEKKKAAGKNSPKGKR